MPILLTHTRYGYRTQHKAIKNINNKYNNINKDIKKGIILTTY